MTTAEIPLWIACGAILKIFLPCLKWLAHGSIAASAVASTFPPLPFGDPQDPDPKLTISQHASSADDLPVCCPPSLIRLCDQMADRGASLARQGRPFNAWTLIAIPEDAQIGGANDIALLAWAARLGYREGGEVKREARR